MENRDDIIQTMDKQIHNIEPQRVYNVDRLIEILQISRNTAYKYLKTGRIKAVKAGGWKILGQNIINYLTQDGN